MDCYATQLSLHRERGASAVEYGLLLAGVVAVIVLAVVAFGGSVADLFTESCEHITASTQTSGTCS